MNIEDRIDGVQDAPEIHVVPTEVNEEVITDNEEEIAGPSINPESNVSNLPRRSARFIASQDDPLPLLYSDNDNSNDDDPAIPGTQPILTRKRLQGRCSGAAASTKAQRMQQEQEEKEAKMRNWQKFWNAEPLGDSIPASQTPFGDCPDIEHLTFYRSARMRRANDDPARGPGNPMVTYNVGDTALIEWKRHDPKEPSGPAKDQAVFRIMAIFVHRRTGLLQFAPQWGRSWSDVLNPYSDADSEEPDDAIRGSKEVFWEAEVGRWPEEGKLLLAHRIYDSEDLQELHNISRPCHYDEFASEAELEEYLAEQDTYFYRYSLPHCGPLRFEALPLPGTESSGYKRVELGPDGKLTMVDAFCGSGSVSDAASDVGWYISFGVEADSEVWQVYAKNVSQAVTSCMTIQEFLQRVLAGDPSVPRIGEVVWLHLSPPCQSLCSQNAHKGKDRYNAELLPLLKCIVQLIDALKPIFISLEEVPRFIFGRMPKVQYTKRKKAQHAKEKGSAKKKQKKAANGAGPSVEEFDDELICAPYFDDDSQEEGEAEEDADEEAATVDDGSERVPSRAWLEVVPSLLQMNYQVDLPIMNSGHYGAPQDRPRMFAVFALRGYELPVPPKPRYHTPYKQVGFAKDDCLATITDWSCMTVQSDPSLPPAVTAMEAIDDLPRLNGATHVAGRYTPRDPNCVSRYSQFMRRGAGPHIFDHKVPHATLRNDNEVDPCRPLSTVIGQDDRWSKTIHYEETMRVLTILERRRGQSFLDKMDVSGAKRDQQKIIGNAVPWLMARAMAEVVYEAATGRTSPAPPVPNLKGWVDANGQEVPGPSPTARARAALDKLKKQQQEASPSKRPSMPPSPQNVVELNNIRDKKLNTPLKMQRIDAFLETKSTGAGAAETSLDSSQASDKKDAFDETASGEVLVELMGEIKEEDSSHSPGQVSGNAATPPQPEFDSIEAGIEVIDLTMDTDDE